MSPKRAYFELGMVRQAIQRDRPVFGLCGGLQVLNVALGGTLIQDIATQVDEALPHQQETSATRTWHRVQVCDGTRLHRILKCQILRVNSAHHQAPWNVAKDLTVNALAPDGIIEGLEASNRRFVIGVQWHPEFLYRRDEASQRLFRAFLKEASRR